MKGRCQRALPKSDARGECGKTTLACRMEILHLHPLAQCELEELMGSEV